MDRKRFIVFLVVVAVILIVGAIILAYMQNQPAPLPAPLAAPSSATSSAADAASSSSQTSAASTTPSSPYPPPSLGEQTGIAKLGGQTLYIDLAQTPAQQELGLGNRSGLGANQGMLFIFPTDDIHMFWMKDMSFSIDMIWFSADGTVIYIQPDVAPDTYPEAFGPNELSRYVLEVPANFAAEHGITVGDQATLP